MSDIADNASPTIELYTDAAISRVRSVAFEQGHAGACDLCGYDFARVVTRTYQSEQVDACGGCRDTFALDK